MYIKLGFKAHDYYFSTVSSPGFGSCHVDKHTARVPDLSPKETLYLVGGSWRGSLTMLFYLSFNYHSINRLG